MLRAGKAHSICSWDERVKAVGVRKSVWVLMSRRQPEKADRDAAAGDGCRGEGEERRGETGFESRALVVLEGARAEGVVVGQSRKCEASNLAASRLRACLLALVWSSAPAQLPRLPATSEQGSMYPC
jgi:hypothetical protein